MIAIAYYLLKVVLCSGLLYGYYHIALRNKAFNAWNRFYLLAAVPFSILLPLVEVNWTATADQSSKVIQAMQVVKGADEYVKENAGSSATSYAQWLPLMAYTLISLILALYFIRALISILHTIRKYEHVPFNEFYFLNTSEPGTPFSFFKYLVWNREIPLEEETGRNILKHELVHIQEKHSWDKVFIHLVLTLFWINPFFWLIRHELSMIHEFIADKKAVGNGNVQAFAQLILAGAFPGHQSLLANSFFQSPIKRRLSMITTKTNPMVAYITRILMLPLIAFTFLVFAVKPSQAAGGPVELDKKYTVVVDAGHGGNDLGISSGGANEKDLALSIARLVRALNKNPNINIVLSRDGDVLQEVRDKVTLSREKKADLFISMHINGSEVSTQSGMEVYIASEENAHIANSAKLAHIMVSQLQQAYPGALSVKQRASKVWVLDHNVCPAVLVECGYLTNQNDKNFISSASNQEKIAQQVLRSIEDYFNPATKVVEGFPTGAALADTIPAGKKLENVIFVYSDGTKETMAQQEYQKRTAGKSITIKSDTLYVDGATVPKAELTYSAAPDAIYYLDGKVIDRKGFEGLTPNEISTISIDKPKDGGKGSIYIFSKKYAEQNKSNVHVGKGNIVISDIRPDSINVQINGKMEKSPTIVKGYSLQAQPLYILDGQEAESKTVELLDPTKILSVDVLKGESAERIYGSKGKSGVVVINTKK